MPSIILILDTFRAGEIIESKTTINEIARITTLKTALNSTFINIEGASTPRIYLNKKKIPIKPKICPINIGIIDIKTASFESIL